MRGMRKGRRFQSRLRSSTEEGSGVYSDASDMLHTSEHFFFWLPVLWCLTMVTLTSSAKASQRIGLCFKMRRFYFRRQSESTRSQERIRLPSVWGNEKVKDKDGAGSGGGRVATAVARSRCEQRQHSRCWRVHSRLRFDVS